MSIRKRHGRGEVWGREEPPRPEVEPLERDLWDASFDALWRGDLRAADELSIAATKMALDRLHDTIQRMVEVKPGACSPPPPARWEGQG